MKPIDKHLVEHYTWGDNCEGWRLMNNNNLSVIQERMPANTTEKLHYHSKAQQFFYILKGTATFIIENEKHVVQQNQGIQILANSRHKIINETESDIEFLVISNPATNNDRININGDTSH